MDSSEKEKLITDYARNMFLQLEEAGVSLSVNEKTQLLKPYLKMPDSYEVITNKLLQDTMRFKEEHDKKVASIEEPFEPLEFYQLPVAYRGLTLNEQDIDLLNIVGASTPEELITVAKTLTNIPTDLTNVTYENLEETKQLLFKEYQNKLIPKNEYFANPNLKLLVKKEFLFNSGILEDEEKELIDNIIKESKNHKEMVEKLQAVFSPDKINQMLKIMRERTPIEKSGIKSSSYEAYVNLYEQLPKFNSLTLDDQFKYGSIVLQDGTQVYHHFEKGLKFAEEHHMQVRGNSLISYMGCPDYIYEAEPSEEMHDIAYQELDNYIKGIFSLLARPEYEGRVRSIDIFNELLNRTGPDYTFRREAPQDVPPSKLDDYKSGWYKHLDLDDICKLIATNKELLGNQKIDFMYNEVFLEDPKKMAAFHQIMSKIKEFEQKNNVQIINTLGIQLHTDSNITKEELINMFTEMAKYGYPIEITEFDMTMSLEDTMGLTEDQINKIRQRKINEILQTIYSLKDQVQIKGFTIWSLTDKHNFEVSLANEERIPNGEDPIETLHGGYFTEEMTPRGEQVRLSYEHPEEQIALEEEHAKKLVYQQQKDNQGFASIALIAIVTGAILGLLLALAILNIK